MRIESLYIDGFGLFTDVRLEALSPGLTVFCGPNESGKSTLLSFIRFMLFGLPDKRSKANRYPPLRTGTAHGGAIVLCESPRRYRLERHDKGTLAMIDGPPGTATSDLEGLLGGITRETFNTIFAFSLHELEELDNAFDQGAVRDALYGATAGLDHQLLSGGEQYIDEGLARIFKPRSKKASINIALTALETLHQGIRTAEDDLTAFDQLQEDITSLEQLIQTAQKRRQEIITELDRLRDLASWLERRNKLTSNVERLGIDLAEVRRKRADIHPDLVVLCAATEIRQLSKGRDYALSLRRQKSDAGQMLGTLRLELETTRVVLGTEWSTERLENFRASIDLAAETDERETKIREAELHVAEARAAERKAMDDRKTALETERQAATAFEGVIAPPLPPDPILYEQLLSGRGDYERATRDLRARDGELRAEDEAFRRALSEINPGWAEDDLQRFDTSLPARQEFERYREVIAEDHKTLDRAREQAKQADIDLARAEARRRQAQERHDGARRPACDDVTALTRLHEVHRQLAVRWAAISNRPSQRWVAPAVGLIGGAAGLVFFLYIREAGIVLTVMSLVIAGFLWRVDRNRRIAVETVEREFATLCRELGLKYSIGYESMMDVGRAIDADIGALRERQALLEQFQQATSDDADALKLVSRVQDAVQNAEKILRERTEDWRRQMETIGLPVSLSPETAIAIVARIELCRARLEAIRTLRHRIQAMERNRQEYLVIFNGMLESRGQPPASHSDISIRLSQFIESIRQANDLRDRKEKLRETWMRTSEERRRVEDEFLGISLQHQQALGHQEECAAGWRDLLSRNSLPPHLTPAAVRDVLQAISRARELLGRIRETEQRLRDIGGQESTFAGSICDLLASLRRAPSSDPVADLDNLIPALESAEAAAQEAAVLDARIGEMDRQIEAMRGDLEESDQHIANLRPAGTNLDINERRRELTTELADLDAEVQGTQDRLLERRRDRKSMATDERLSQMYEQKQARIEEISQGARQWAVLALARYMFEEARKRYEEKRQPAVVRRASNHLRFLTRDRYREVRMPLDGSDLHVLPTGDGLPKTVGQLSRGTAEQLYLALRFGFIEEFADNRSPLPIVIDDILVNFDPSRATAAIETLIRLSAQFQILYFTCHPSTADIFRGIDSSVPVFRLSNGSIGVTA